MKLKFLTIKKKTIFVVLLCILATVTFCATYFTVKATSSPKPLHTIVIDAGHGGKDGGAVGKTTEVTESFLNLEYSKTLKSICEQYGFKVVMTRSDMAGLYSPLASNKKKSEMEKRQKIIEKASPDLMVSIHMNSFPSSEARGAQVYFGEGNLAGKELADKVSISLNKNIDKAKKTSKVGDFFVLNCTSVPSVLVECGFLSNPEEEVLLQSEDYRNKFCYTLFCGILQFYSKD